MHYQDSNEWVGNFILYIIRRSKCGYKLPGRERERRVVSSRPLSSICAPCAAASSLVYPSVMALLMNIVS